MLSGAASVHLEAQQRNGEIKNHFRRNLQIQKTDSHHFAHRSNLRIHCRSGVPRLRVDRATDRSQVPECQHLGRSQCSEDDRVRSHRNCPSFHVAGTQTEVSLCV